MASLGLIDFVIILEEKGYFVIEEYQADDGYVLIFEGETLLDRHDVQLIEEVANYEIRGVFNARLIAETIEVIIFDN